MVGETHAPRIHEKQNPTAFFFWLGIIGLGGSSLINAGVFLKADERTLQMSPWPSEIRDDPSTLDECELSMDMENISRPITKCRLHTC